MRISLNKISQSSKRLTHSDLNKLTPSRSPSSPTKTKSFIIQLRKCLRYKLRSNLFKKMFNRISQLKQIISKSSPDAKNLCPKSSEELSSHLPLSHINSRPWTKSRRYRSAFVTQRITSARSIVLRTISQATRPASLSQLNKKTLRINSNFVISMLTLSCECFAKSSVVLIWRDLTNASVLKLHAQTSSTSISEVKS